MQLRMMQSDGGVADLEVVELELEREHLGLVHRGLVSPELAGLGPVGLGSRRQAGLLGLKVRSLPTVLVANSSDQDDTSGIERREVHEIWRRQRLYKDPTKTPA